MIASAIFGISKPKADKAADAVCMPDFIDFSSMTQRTKI